MRKILTGLLITLALLSPVSNADPFTDTWEWVEEHGSVASAIGAPIIPMGTLHSGLSIAQSNASLKKSAFTVELTSSKVENIIPRMLIS
jgi:hypothetical protein